MFCKSLHLRGNESLARMPWLFSGWWLDVELAEYWGLNLSTQSTIINTPRGSDSTISFRSPDKLQKKTATSKLQKLLNGLVLLKNYDFFKQIHDWRKRIKTIWCSPLQIASIYILQKSWTSKNAKSHWFRILYPETCYLYYFAKSIFELSLIMTVSSNFIWSAPMRSSNSLQKT